MPDLGSVDLIQVEIKEVVDIGYLNGLFVLARSIGLIGASTSVHHTKATGELCAALQTCCYKFCTAVERLTSDKCCAGHALDQKRLQQPLYRHPWDDVRLDSTFPPYAYSLSSCVQTLKRPLLMMQVLYTR